VCGLDAQRIGLELTGQNIANVNTPGYARRVVDFASVPGQDSRSAGGGVSVEGIRAIRDSFLERRVQQEVPAEGRAAALAELLQVVQTGIGTAGASLDARLSEVFGSFSRLADAPASAVARADVLNATDELAQSFHDISSRLVDSQRSAEGRVRSTVEEINSLAQQLSALNRSLSSAGADGKLSVQDKQAVVIRELSTLVDIDVLERPEGGLDVTIGNGRALVIAGEAYAVEAVAGPPNGLSAIESGGRVITNEINGGRLAGAIEARDVQIPDYISRLDTIAFEVAGQVNALHRTGFDQQGNTNQDFFTPLGAVAGAARLIAVDPAVAADGRLIAAAGVNQAGDNAVAKSLASLRDALVLDGNTATLVEGWSNLAYRVGRDTRAAIDGQKAQADIVKQIDALRDSVSGVSLDEEAVNMIKFQRAFEANARYFSAVDQTLNVLFQIVGR
jgi:flagellar hook-associated protein 1 FlgK